MPIWHDDQVDLLLVLEFDNLQFDNNDKGDWYNEPKTTGSIHYRFPMFGYSIGHCFCGKRGFL